MVGLWDGIVPSPCWLVLQTGGNRAFLVSWEPYVRGKHCLLYSLSVSFAKVGHDNADCILTWLQGSPSAEVEQTGCDSPAICDTKRREEKHLAGFRITTLKQTSHLHQLACVSYTELLANQAK